MNADKSNYKKCLECNEIKLLEGNFYKAGKNGKNWQSYCIQCQNYIKRKQYKFQGSKGKYVKRLTGFLKYPKELQEKIIYDKHCRINFKDITDKYKEEFPFINYYSLLKFNKNNQIPKYIEIVENNQVLEIKENKEILEIKELN